MSEASIRDPTMATVESLTAELKAERQNHGDEMNELMNQFQAEISEKDGQLEELEEQNKRLKRNLESAEKAIEIVQE